MSRSRGSNEDAKPAPFADAEPKEEYGRRCSWSDVANSGCGRPVARREVGGIGDEEKRGEERGRN